MANGDITNTNLELIGANKGFASGTFVGDGNATNIPLGFKPSKIVIYNLTDAEYWIWVAGITEGTMVTGSDASELTSGVTLFDGDDDESMGFTIPATAVLNTAADVIVWEAWI